MLAVDRAARCWLTISRYRSRMIGQDEHDLLGELLADASTDDEPTTLEEDEGVAEARAQIARGDVLLAQEIRRGTAPAQ